MKKKLEFIGYALSIMFILWICASVVDVDVHNMSDQQYAWWNFFELVF